MSEVGLLTPTPAQSRESPGTAAWSYLAGLALALLGAAVLFGWFFDIPLLKSIRTDWVSMKTNTALGFALSGVALWQLRFQALQGWRFRLVQACAVSAALIGLLTLAEYIAGWQLGIDNLLIANSLHAIQTSNAIRMPPNSALAMVFGNAALLLLAGANQRSFRLTAAGTLASLTLLLGLFGAAGYADSSSAAYSWGNLSSMPVHSVLGFVVLGAAGLSIAWIKGGWRWSVGAPVVAGSGFGMLLLIGLSLESFHSTRQFVDNSHWVEHTQEVRTVIGKLDAAIATALSAERGFVITGREESLTPYALGNQHAVEDELRLRELTADNPRQQARLVKLDALLQQKLDFFGQVVKARRTGGTDRAASLIDTGRGQALVDAIYSITRQMDSEEQNLLAQRKVQLAASIDRTLLILPTGTLLAIGLFLGALLHLNAEATERQRVAAEVGASEARFRSLVLATSQIVWTTDASGNVHGPLPSWQAYTGQSDEEIQGSGWSNALHPDDMARALDAWGQAVEAKSMFEIDYRIRRHDGVYRNFSARGVAVLNRDGSVREWVRSCRDVTDRRKAEAERDRFFSLSLDLMCIANMDGYFLRINPAFETILGFNQTDLLSRPFLDFVHPEDQAATLEVMQSLETGAMLINFENRYLCKDGSYRWLQWSSAPVVEEARIYAVAHDITERKRVDADMRQLNANLDQRVIERTAQLEAANKELEAFSYSVSHDLRAPLRGVDSFSRMVVEDYGQMLDDEGRRMLNVVRSESQRMGQLIDDLLAFSRVGRLEMRRQSIDMNELVQGVIDKLDVSPERRQQIKVMPLPNILGDRNLIQQVLVNLLSNALKFSSHQPAPIIEIGASLEGGLATYYVKDNGAGFDSRYVHKLFGVFQRLHTEDEFEGTGVGLALVQRIVQRHGGSVRAEGEINKGATFYFSLPVSEEHIA
ncbi:MAG: PAS domain S-box protein [Lysobacteraceae bacterium]